MNREKSGFSIIELLLVCVVLVVTAVVATPHLQKAIGTPGGSNTFAALRSVAGSELSYFTQNGRYARITEINNLNSGSIGTQSGNDVIRGKFTISMVPAAPTDAELRTGYTITAVRDEPGEEKTYVYELDQSGELRQIFP